MSAMERYDAVIVGARCAGSPLAIELARAGWDVLLIDRDQFPSDTLSTNGIWPNGLARLDALGALDLLCDRHEIKFLEHRSRVFEHEISGTFTPVGGHRLCIGPRRRALDSTLLDIALTAGAKARLGERVQGLVGAGKADDPVRGVVTGDGETIEARWVIGADGRASTVAGALGLAKTRPLRGEMAMMFAYWTGLPESPYMHFHGEADAVLSWGNAEDGVGLVILNCRPGLTRGDAESRTAAYLEGIRHFPATLEPERLEDAERVTEVKVAPETMLRGYFRQAAGPGWALVGDAGHFKHPSTAQGIGDALEGAHQLAEALLGADPELEGYEDRRDARAAAAYEWSFNFARFPRRGGGDVVFAGLERDPEAAQDFRDVLSRVVDPRSELFTPERLERWFGAPADLEPVEEALDLAERVLRLAEEPARVLDRGDHLVGRELLGDAAKGGGDDSGDRPGALGVVDRPDQAGAERIAQVRVVDEALPALRRGEREGQGLARDVEVAGCAVERREGDLLGDLVEAARRAPLPGLAGIVHGLRLVRRAAERKRGDDEDERGGDGAGDEGPPAHSAHSSTLRRARPIGTSAARPKAAAIRKEALKACVAARSSWS